MTEKEGSKKVPVDLTQLMKDMEEWEKIPEVERNLRTRLNELANGDWVALATKPEFGALNFQDIVPTLERFKSLVRLFRQADLSLLSNERINAAIGALNSFDNVFSRVSKFDIRQNRASEVRNEISVQVTQQYNSLFESLDDVIAIGVAKRVDPDALNSSVEAQVKKRIEEELSQRLPALERIREAGEQADETLEAIKSAAAQVGVSAHATIFARQAEEHENAALRWAYLTAIIAAITVVWGLVALWGIPIPANAPLGEIVQQALAKLIVFSALSYGLVWCARNYSANRHNYVLNKHRQNSLSTFETFVKAAQGDADIKNAVLLQATTSIFAAQGTGYTSNEPDMDQPNKIIEIIKSVRPAN